MSLRDADCSWLPDHQLHVVETLAHVDHTIERLLRLTHDYTEHGTITFAEVSKGDRVDVVVREVAPLPQAIPRLVADALTQSCGPRWNTPCMRRLRPLLGGC
ncbi:hypothetical protein [Streptomyces sp. NPDC002619]|uniref:hypothetical protein n=1 Tax=Streptomyces sp. NPDC002619 TaxID=3364655 RepID=UPI00367444DB